MFGGPVQSCLFAMRKEVVLIILSLWHYYRLLTLSGAASYWLSEGSWPALNRGKWTNGGVVRRRDGFLPSNEV